MPSKTIALRSKFAMKPHFEEIVSKVEPIHDSIYGPRYRCELTLKDGTFLPCAILQSKSKVIELAKRRIKEEMTGKGKIGGPDPYGQILSVFVAGGNKVNDYDVASASPSRFAPPLSLLREIKGETTMAWTGWVFEMTDGKLFSYGSSFHMEFFDLPGGYTFDEVSKVHNHSYVSKNGSLVSLVQGGLIPTDYDIASLFREKVHFLCYLDGI
jgi:hypothetical protein